ncbi:MAG: hypothetical protein M1268_02965 [Patescibacteria group bacterium]|nr:hypothetical protein [Patescibacteria group bacterium]
MSDENTLQQNTQDIQPTVVVSGNSSPTNKRNPAGLVLFIFLLLVVAGIISYFLLFKGKATSPVVTATPTLMPTSRVPTSTPISSPTASLKPTGPVSCSDPQCLASNFLQCKASKLTMPFGGGGNSTYIITVFGLENGKCHYSSKVVDQNGAPLISEVDCVVPKELITDDIITHFFGNDKMPGKEKILAEQTKIETDYCKKVNR